MIDTVAITLEQEQFKIFEHKKFSPSSEGLFMPPYYPLNKGSFACVQNPSKKALREGIYKPRLTLIRRFSNGGFSITLRIEFSAPKLIFGNNFEELKDEDFEMIIRSLVMLLWEMGVIVNYQTLKKARVSAIHYSKNVLLEHTLCHTAISEIAKVNPFPQMDTNQTDYRNGGHSYKLHSNNFELVFYDKVKDLEQAKKSEKRAIEKHNAIQLNLFEPLKDARMNVLRIEARFGSGKKIKDLLKKIAVPMDALTFEQLFKKEIAKKALLFLMKEIAKGFLIDRMPVDFNNLSQTFKELMFYNDRKQLDTLLRLFPLILFIKQDGAEKTRNMLGYRGKKGNQKWSREMKTIRELDKAKDMKIPILLEIGRSLEAFESIRLSNLPAFDFINTIKKSRFQYAKP